MAKKSESESRATQKALALLDDPNLPDELSVHLIELLLNTEAAKQQRTHEKGIAKLRADGGF